MAIPGASLRKAAVLLRSVDVDTAATLLGQLSAEEAATLREAVRALGPLDPEEQADVVAEFRRERPVTSESAGGGVELSLSSDIASRGAFPEAAGRESSFGQRFDFLESAPPHTLATYLAREQAQTVAVVLSHIPPAKAAEVLAALPAKLQADTVERLSNLGETDTEVVRVLEHELASWAKKRAGGSSARGGRRDTVASILAAANATTRAAIVANLRQKDVPQRVPSEPARSATTNPSKTYNDEYRVVKSLAKRHQVNGQLRSLAEHRVSSQPSMVRPPASGVSPATRPGVPRVEFNHLVQLDTQLLSQLLAAADANVLALALAGSDDALVERICDQMPKRVAKTFRRELRRMGPTRLSDVEAAQRQIADLASEQLAARRSETTLAMRPQASFAAPDLL